LETVGATQTDGDTPDPLRSFCSGLLAAFPQGTTDGPGPLSSVQQELVRVLGQGVAAVAANLRSELPAWAAAIEQLKHLGQSSFLPDPVAVHTLREQLERARDQACQVVKALEAAAEGPPLPRRALLAPPAATGKPATFPRLAASP